MLQFINRYRVRLTIALTCYAFILMPSAREFIWIAIAFLFGMLVEPWVQQSENFPTDR